MDYDTLDYLIPPVRKRSGNDGLTKENNLAGVVRRFKRLSTKLGNYNTQFSQTPITDIGSPTGLKRSDSKLLGNQFMISNYTKKKTSKNNFKTNGKKQKFTISNSNIIKITVVPVTTESSKIASKNNKIGQRIRKTVSNTSSCIKTNILIPARHRRENHDIRESSSADLFIPRWERNTKYDEITLNRIRNAKHIINSLNMSQKERQERISRDFRERQVSPKTSKKTYQGVREGCICNNTKINTILDDMNSRNRLSIVGRLGLTDNDQYILNCAATLNDIPIDTIPCNTPYTSQHKVNSACIEEFESYRGINKTTKATQADINICFTNNKIKNTNENNKNLHCDCQKTKDVATTISDGKLDHPREQKSPLIVISVYPTKDTIGGIKDFSDLIQINQLPDSRQNEKNRSMNLKTTGQKVRTTIEKKSVVRSPEKRPPSPLSKVADKVENRASRNRSPMSLNKNFNNNKFESTSLRSRSCSPSVKTTARENNINILNKQISQKSITNRDRQNHPTINYRATKVLSQKDKSNRNQIIVNAAQTSKINPFRSSNGGIKEAIAKKNKIKKAIVDSYTQRMLISEEKNAGFTRVETKPTSNASSVTINIDGDNEHYRVLFLQDKLNTDLNIRKTLKMPKQKVPDLKNKEKGNMEDNHTKTNKVKPRMNLGNQSKQFNNSQDVRKSTGIKIRDSLEMCRWLETGENYENKKKNHNGYEPTVKLMNKNVSKNAKKEDVTAPVKHYRGDQCCVPSPTLRDQEIRDLLGIKTLRPGSSKFVQEVLPELIGHKLHYTLHPEMCEGSKKEREYKSSLNETQNTINVSDQPKRLEAWTQYEASITNSYKQMVLNRNIQVFLQVEQFTKQKPIMLSRKQYEKVKKTIKKKVSKKFSQERRKLNNSTKCSVVSIGEIRKTRKQQTSNEKICRTVQVQQNSMLKQEIENKQDNNSEENNPIAALQTQQTPYKNEVPNSTSPRQAVSSMEIHYVRSMAHLRHVTFSSSNIKSKPGSLLCLEQKNCPSVQTIFKGPKKCVTPNLGTSAYSLYSDDYINDSDKNSYALDEKPKRPFLRRLMSCLVMRSNRASEAILPRQHEQRSGINSFDSYHINTSLGAIELTSSLYDTSASFYSNHTILPIAKMKRGFLSSVRGFLTNLKNR